MGQKLRGRAWRRLQQLRMKARAIAAFSDLDPANAILIANHMKSCSCHMCGNPRRYWGEITLQEKRQALRERDQE
ncbi:hypothetical protein ACEUZ9_000949 [Paracoccus litorisediminis]|uniref:hypothetical protein n=1 Tax=Paracoccus litorisediminis TaxID=2006130 RepID=UPI00372E0D38